MQYEGVGLNDYRALVLAVDIVIPYESESEDVGEIKVAN